MAEKQCDWRDRDLARMNFWELRALYVRLLVSGATSSDEQTYLKDIGFRLDDMYGTAWRLGKEPVFH
ncbi:hypothetical protein CLV78_110140 [Aliiruegeria haliotis]|uniref:Uncharacterized protein n=1 Tax=Aliiruegeria haliotis TaxID=1280846 RepID=A0A2T0RJA3_9RHOB|nr:hypothetical protein CLV78_110140 [Aliiruegeria haliotis]